MKITEAQLKETQRQIKICNQMIRIHESEVTIFSKNAKTIWKRKRENLIKYLNENSDLKRTKMPREKIARTGIKMYNSINGITPLGVKYSKQAHKSKFKANGKRKIPKEMAEEALGLLLSY